MSNKIRIPIEIKQADYTRLVWSITPEPNVTIEDILKPEFWANVSRNLRSGHRVEIIPQDNSYFAEVFVMAASTNWAKVILLRKVDLIEKNETNVETSGCIVKWAGPHDKWRITRGTEVISKGHEDESLAYAWLTEHLKTIK